MAVSLHPDTDLIRFGAFELNLRSRELRKDSRSTGLPEQSIKILHMLLEGQGGLILRDEIRARLWPNDAVIEFDHSINAAMRKLRVALGDSANCPRYIETLTGRGYRWIGPLTRHRPKSDDPSSQLSDPSLTGVTFRTSTPPAQTRDKSVAVLPFADMSALHDQEYFADGLVEETLHLLFKVPTLKVSGRTSAFQFKGRTEDVRAIGAKLGVAYVVEGAVRRSGNGLRVTAQLIDTRTGQHKWSDTYDRDIGSALQVQSEIATAIARGVQVQINSPAELHADVESSLYSRGLHAEARYELAGFEEAVTCYKHVLANDPTFVPAAEALARALKGHAEWGFLPPQTAWQRVRSAAEQALRLEPHSAIAHALLSRVHSEYDWDWYAAAGESEIAVALAPNDPDVLTSAAIVRLAIGEFSEAAQLVEIASKVDPLNADIHIVKSWTCLRLGQFADAERFCQHAIELSPTYVWGHRDLGLALLCQGSYEEALSEMKREVHPGGRLSGIALACHALQRSAEADSALSSLVTQYANEMALRIAEVYAFRGDRDQAIRWLERAYRQKDFELYCIKSHPLFARLQTDPGYLAMLRQMRLA